MFEPEEEDEIQVRVEDGVLTRSAVRVYRGDLACFICLKDVPEAAELSCTDVYDDDKSHREALDICEGCAYRVATLFDARYAGKGLFCGVLQDAD
jgi:hypothetical protein